VAVAKEKLKEARTRQKSYADKHHRSMEGYKYHPLHVISYPLDQIRADLSYVEEPEAILDRQDRVMRNKTILSLRFFGGTIPSGKPLGKLRSLSGLL
nr:putative reverse transcriptase domain-containing protein [Tanacetum cinerariifolium]